MSCLRCHVTKTMSDKLCQINFVRCHVTDTFTNTQCRNFDPSSHSHVKLPFMLWKLCQTNYVRCHVTKTVSDKLCQINYVRYLVSCYENCQINYVWCYVMLNFVIFWEDLIFRFFNFVKNAQFCHFVREESVFFSLFQFCQKWSILSFLKSGLQIMR